MIQIERVLYPTDFSDGSRQALDYACHMATRCGAELHILHVLQELPIYSIEPGLTFPMGSDFLTDVRQDAQQALTALTLPWGVGQAMPVVRAMREGNPASQIVDYARDLQCGLIVIGTHGRSRLAHLLMGSVAEKVVRTAPCPVMTIRPLPLQAKEHLAEHVPAIDASPSA